MSWPSPSLISFTSPPVYNEESRNFKNFDPPKLRSSHSGSKALNHAVNHTVSTKLLLPELIDTNGDTTARATTKLRPKIRLQPRVSSRPAAFASALDSNLFYSQQRCNHLPARFGNSFDCNDNKSYPEKDGTADLYSFRVIAVSSSEPDEKPSSSSCIKRFKATVLHPSTDFNDLQKKEEVHSSCCKEGDSCCSSSACSSVFLASPRSKNHAPRLRKDTAFAA